jgi:hypothetical protein
MNEITTYLIGLSISLAFVLGAAVYIRKPLFTILTDLCGTDDRAAFWTQITMLGFILVGGLMALTYEPRANLPEYYFISWHLGRTMIGLVIVVVFLSLTVSIFIRRETRQTVNLKGSQKNVLQ